VTSAPESQPGGLAVHNVPEAPEGPPELRHRIEEGLLVAVITAMVVLPIVAVLARWTTGAALPGANLWVQMLNLWVAFLGGAYAARTHQHVALASGTVWGIQGPMREVLVGFTAAVATAVTAWLAYASASLVVTEMESSLTLWGGVPMWAMELVMPVGFLIMAARFAWRQNPTTAGRVANLSAVALSTLLAFVPAGEREWVVWGGAAVLLVAVSLGAPLFTAMGGMAMLLFFGAPVPVALSAVPSETVRLVADPMLVSLPLFTFAGYLLAEGGAARRLVLVFNAFFGWLPGGVPAAAVMVCAFFTTFTGASGVTILALGGLLLPALEEAGYSRSYSIGLITAAGSIGILFPPSLPVILYGVSGQIPIPDLYAGGLVPGAFVVLLVIGMSVVVGIREQGWAAYLPSRGDDAIPFAESATNRLKLMGNAAWVAKWEILLPVLVIVAIFGGFLTLFEAAAFTAAYPFVVSVFLHRDLTLRDGVVRAALQTTALMGGVLCILGVALGLTSYLVDAEVPLHLRDAVLASVHSKIAFLLLLNLVLIVVGAMMDIYSAIVVVVPLIIPVALEFGIHPVHLGILFLANLELGYLTPPVGENLFMSSFRFDEPLTKVYRHSLPFYVIILVGVLLVSYVPGATLWAVDADAGQPTDFFEGLDEMPSPEGSTPAPAPAALTPEQMELLLDDDPTNDPVVEPTPAPAAPTTPQELDMDAIMKELEE